MDTVSRKYLLFNTLMATKQGVFAFVRRFMVSAYFLALGELESEESVALYTSPKFPSPSLLFMYR